MCCQVLAHQNVSVGVMPRKFFVGLIQRTKYVYFLASSVNRQQFKFNRSALCSTPSGLSYLLCLKIIHIRRSRPIFRINQRIFRLFIMFRFSIINTYYHKNTRSASLQNCYDLMLARSVCFFLLDQQVRSTYQIAVIFSSFCFHL